MLICLPLVSFLLFILFYRNKFSSFGWRVAYILSAVTLVFSAVIFIEIASLFSSVTSFSVIGFWVAVTFLSTGLLWWSDAKKLPRLCSVPKLGSFEFVCVAGIITIFMINAVVAFCFPPNNWDSMTYHLPRVMHWATNANVSFYPTQIERQLFNQPGAEFALLHCFLLTGGDQWFNFLQWISLVGCVLAATLIAGFLGAGMRGQILTALFVTTIPMAILQSTSTQNDLFVSFWIIAFVALVLTLQKQFSHVIFYAAAMALGLSVLAKGTFIVAFPFMVYFVISLWKKGFKYIFLCLGIVLVIVAGHYARSWVWQHGKSFLGNEQLELLTKRHDLPAIGVNLISQIASEILSPWPLVNRSVEKFGQEGMAFFRVDVHDQKMFEQVFRTLKPIDFFFDEDYAPNPFHMFIIFCVLSFLWISRPKREVWLYSFSVVASCLIFVFIVQWQPFITRLHLPLFMLFSPLIGLLIGRWKGLTILISILLFGIAYLMIVSHATRPIRNLNKPVDFPRKALYFMNKPARFSSYVQASNMILSSGCRDIGLLQGSDSWEYPLWAFTGYGKRVHFRSLNLDGLEGSSPCMVVVVDVYQDEVLISGKEIFNLVWQGTPLQIFKRAQ